MLDEKCGLPVSVGNGHTLVHVWWCLRRSRCTQLHFRRIQGSSISWDTCPPRPDALQQTFSGKGPLPASSKISLRMSDLEHKPTLSTEQRQVLPSESCKDKNQIHQSDWQDTHRSGRCETACPMGEQGLISNS